MTDSKQYEATVLNDDYEGIGFGGFPVFGGNKLRRARSSHAASMVVKITSQVEAVVCDVVHKIHDRRTNTAPAIGEQLLSALGEAERQQIPPIQTPSQESA